MRDKIAAHKPTKGALDIKGGPGGLVELEFALQVTQLVSGQCHHPNISAALACMQAAGLASPEVCDAHRLIARMLVMLRDRKGQRLNSSPNAHLVCRPLLEKNKLHTRMRHST